MPLAEYVASNYSMGNKILTKTFTAWSNTDAMREAERLMPGANALPGSHPRAAAKARVIGVKRV